jgi:hypothetical protein
LGHSEDKCWKKPKDGKSTVGTANFLEVLLDDGAATEQQLNKLCGNENLFSYTQVPRRRTPVDVALRGVAPIPEVEREGVGANRDTSVRSKILSHFIKGKIPLSPMETILMIPRELGEAGKEKKGFGDHRESSFSGLCTPVTKEDLHQQDASEQNSTSACGNQQLHCGRFNRYRSIYVCTGCCCSKRVGYDASCDRK